MDFNWKMPIEWCHSGLPQGNALFGSLICGARETLKITFNRSDYWFYSDNLPPGKEQSYENLKKYLTEGDETEVKRVFGGYKDGKRPSSSTRLPMGRLDIALPQNDDASLSLDTTSSLGRFANNSGSIKIESIVPRAIPLLVLSIKGKDAKSCRFSSLPAATDEVMTFFTKHNFNKAKKFDAENNKSGGWIQEVPGSRTLCVYWEVSEKTDSLELYLASALESNSLSAEKSAKKIVRDAQIKGFDKIATETAMWWNDYWKRVPRIELPDKEISELYYLGMYRLAGIASPDAPPATLQGPWAEEYRIPPWSCDYHFNINVQECYWPVFAGNIPEFILPLFDMIKKWGPVLKKYAENFVGIKDGLMLPHATDDKGTGLGGFWPGHIDHSCTAWVAQLMWLYWKYTLDENFLNEALYPFMKSVMNVYSAMLEKDEKGNLFLPAESSPEYHENRINACGRNSSIHLAAIHFLANSLLEASEKLNVVDDKTARWQEIISKLPLFSTSSSEEICIWDGQPLEEPHRHFSHLASLHPFDLLEWRNSGKDAKLLKNTICKWIKQGTGLWSGWSFPWASVIYSRLGMPESAHTMLSIFRRAFMGNDYALRYLPERSSFTAVAGPSASLIMQIEAGMASAAAVMEMCVYTSRGVIYPFAGIPSYWHDLTFEGIRTEGAFLVSGVKKDDIIQKIEVYSEKGGLLKIALPPGKFTCGNENVEGGKIYEAVLPPLKKLFWAATPPLKICVI